MKERKGDKMAWDDTDIGYYQDKRAKRVGYLVMKYFQESGLIGTPFTDEEIKILLSKIPIEKSHRDK